MKRNKFEYLYVLQGYYSHGWEDLAAEDQTLQGRKAIRQTRKEYQENERGAYRIIKRRVISGHRSLSAAVTASAKFSRAVRRANGQNSYIPTRIEYRDGGGEWLGVPIYDVQDAEQHLFNR